MRAALRKHLWLVASLVVGGSVLTLTLVYRFGYDHGALQYIAWGWLNGKWPYINTWDTSFPSGAYFPHMLIISIGGQDVILFRILDVLFQLLTLFLLFLITTKLSNLRAGAIAVILYSCMYISSGYYQTGQRDGFIVPFLLFVILCLLNFQKTPRTTLMFYAGLSMGLAIFIRPTYLLIALIVFLIFVFSLRSDLRKGSRGLFIYTAAFSIPLITFMLIYFVRGAFSKIIDLLQYLLIVYPSLERSARLDVMTALIRYPSKWIIIGSVLFGLHILYRRSLRPFIILLIVFGTIISLRLLESKTFYYQFWPYLAITSILAGIGWGFGTSSLISIAPISKSWARLAANVLVMLLMIAPIAANGHIRMAITEFFPHLAAELTAANHYENLVASPADQAELARYLSEHTPVNETIQLWGPQPGVYYAAGHFAASRFANPLALVCTGWKLFDDCEDYESIPQQNEWAQEFLEDIVENKPVYIVAHYQNNSLESKVTFGTAPDFPGLRLIIDRDYVFETNIGMWSVFRIKSSGQS